MTEYSRRNVLRTGLAAVVIPPGLAALSGRSGQPAAAAAQPADSDQRLNSGAARSNGSSSAVPMKIQYLEMVTPDVDALCGQYESIYGITFGEADPNFGNARTAKLNDGGLLGIRRPMRDTEKPVVRPYLLVDDIKAAVQAATESGARIAMGPMEIPGQGMFAIVIHGGIECGFWQN